jgi:hypothetical protein
MKTCEGCVESPHCLYAPHVHVLCPCPDCIVKITCGAKDRSKCIDYKKFKKRNLEEVLLKTKIKDFEIKIPIKKRRGRK